MGLGRGLNGSVRRAAVFLAAGGKQNRSHKDNNDDGHDEEWGSNVHGADSYSLEYQNPRACGLGRSILLFMHDNPAEDWQALAEHYRQMDDVELGELAADFGDLTATAQEVLRSELRNRGLAEPGARGDAPKKPEAATPKRWASSVDPDKAGDRADESERRTSSRGRRRCANARPRDRPGRFTRL
jgi:hypothetical protein